jgi:hypothetical protein
VTTTEDFLSCPVPVGVRVLATNPPFNQHSAFVERSVALLDSYELDAAVLLFRHDHLQSESRHPPRVRISALRRAAAIHLCRWRPTWIANTSDNGRWTFSWVVWLHDHYGPPEVFWPDRRVRRPATRSHVLSSTSLSGGRVTQVERW